MTWETLVEAFLGSLDRQGKAPRTLEAARIWLGALQRFSRAHGLENPEHFRPEHLALYRQHLLWQPGVRGKMLAQHTVSLALRMARSLFRWAQREGLLLLDPARDLVLPALPRASRRLTAANLDRVRRTLAPTTPIGLRDAALFELAHELTLAQLVALDLEHVEWVPRSAVWLSSGRLRLDDRSARALREYVLHGRPHLAADSPHPALFLGLRGHGRLGAEGVRARLRQLGEPLGLGSLQPRLIRRCARELAEELVRPRLPLLTRDGENFFESF